MFELNALTRRGRWLALTAVGVSAVGMIPAATAGAAVTWNVDGTGTALSVKATAGDQVVMSCSAGTVRVSATVLTTVPCATLASLAINGSSLDDDIDASNMGAKRFPALTSITITGQGGNDRLLGSQLADTILAGTGNDIVRAGNGNDTVQGNAGNDDMVGGAGEDDLSGGAGDDEMTAGKPGALDRARDELYGGDGANTINATDQDFVQNAAADPSADSVAWNFTWPVSQVVGTSINGGDLSIVTAEAADWSLNAGGDCGCAVIRATSRVSGSKVGVNHTGGPISLTMSDGDDRFTANFGMPDQVFVTGNVVVNGGAGTDVLRIRVQDTGSVVVTETEVTIPGLPTIQYTGIETVTLVQVNPA